MALKRRVGAPKSPSIFSNDFIIQNHADIVSCVAMLIVVGLLFQVTSPLATTFVALQHNATELTQYGTNYTNGLKDLCIIFFYFLISIVIHAVVQEYALDKINRKLHLSKTKHSKFNESGQLLTFYAISLLWAGEIIRRDAGSLSLSNIWSNYPEGHVAMPYLTKFYFIIQIAYWAHQFPELYFQKVKKDEMTSKIIYSSLYLIAFTSAYVFNFTKFALLYSFLHYSAEALFHISRILYFSNKTKVYKYTFNVWNFYFTLIRLAGLALGGLTFFYGLATNEKIPALFDLSTGNFNSFIIRTGCLGGFFALQAYMMINFFHFHLKRWNEKANEVARRKKNLAAKAAAAAKKSEDEEASDLPEVDQQQSVTPSPVVKKSAPVKSNKVKVK